jgi:large subunit ribosomal protein L25
MRKLIVKGLINDMPDKIEVDMSNMHIGDNIKVSDLAEDKLQFLDHPSAVVVLVKTARAIIDIEDEEEEEGEEGAEGAEGTETAEGEDKPAEE